MDYIKKIPAIPEKSSSLKILYVKFSGFATGKENEFSKMLTQLRHYAFENHYHLVNISVDNRDKTNESFYTSE